MSWVTCPGLHVLPILFSEGKNTISYACKRCVNLPYSPSFSYGARTNQSLPALAGPAFGRPTAASGMRASKRPALQWSDGIPSQWLHVAGRVRNFLRTLCDSTLSCLSHSQVMQAVHGMTSCQVFALPSDARGCTARGVWGRCLNILHDGNHMPNAVARGSAAHRNPI